MRRDGQGLDLVPQRRQGVVWNRLRGGQQACPVYTWTEMRTRSGLVPQAKSGSRCADWQLPGRPFPQFDLGLAAFTRFQLVHGDSADVAPVVDFEFAFFFQ